MRTVWCVGLVLPALFLTLDATGRSGEKKDGARKTFLSAADYQALATRSIQAIETAAADAKGASRIETEAMILAGYAVSAQSDAKDAAGTFSAALAAAASAKKGNVKHLADFGKLVAKSSADAKFGPLQANDLNELMYLFRGKAKGGEGIHADLQYQPKLKNLNGIEALIGALATKKLSDANLDKVSKELVHLGYRVAAVGVITHGTAPAKDVGRWRELSDQMRDTSIALAESARKKNADGIMKAALGLETSCTQCHMAFKKN